MGALRRVGPAVLALVLGCGGDAEHGAGGADGAPGVADTVDAADAAEVVGPTDAVEADGPDGPDGGRAAGPDAAAPDAGPDAGDTGGDAGGDAGGSGAGSLPWLHARRGDEAGLYDALGRQVLLRGVNFNHLGDYFETHPTLPSVAPLGDDDWDDAAALGTGVIRLVTSWSAWQPERGAFDEAYLAKVRAAIAAANDRGVYVVVDMHQDAWSRHIYTPVDEVCPEGTHHQRGWDGAPAWATFTDGEPTCTPGGREDSPAVIRAWESFYADREGIRTELSALWARIAAELAHEPGVAGFDLINEPGNGASGTATQAGLTAFYRDTITAIRAAEAEVGGPGHALFFEPSVYAVIPDTDLHDDPNLVFAPHNYFESIVKGAGLLDASFAAFAGLAADFGMTLWIGEYGSFSDAETNAKWLARFAALEDAAPGAGSAWWQWEQACGDPHSVQYPPSPEWLEAQQATCGDARFTPIPCVERAYPRAVPGRLLAIEGEPCAGHLVVRGETLTSGTADLWVPSSAAPVVTGEGLGAITPRQVPGGWRVDVEAAGTYVIDVAFTPRAR